MPVGIGDGVRSSNGWCTGCSFGASQSLLPSSQRVCHFDHVEPREIDLDTVFAGAVQASEHDARNHPWGRQALTCQRVPGGAAGQADSLGLPRQGLHPPQGRLAGQSPQFGQVASEVRYWALCLLSQRARPELRRPPPRYGTAMSEVYPVARAWAVLGSRSTARTRRRRLLPGNGRLPWRLVMALSAWVGVNRTADLTVSPSGDCSCRDSGGLLISGANE
jgi:hypothetical protein